MLKPAFIELQLRPLRKDLPIIIVSTGMYQQMGQTVYTETPLYPAIRPTNPDQNSKRSNQKVIMYLMFQNAGTRRKYSGNADNSTLPRE